MHARRRDRIMKDSRATARNTRRLNVSALPTAAREIAQRRNVLKIMHAAPSTANWLLSRSELCVRVGIAVSSELFKKFIFIARSNCFSGETSSTDLDFLWSLKLLCEFYWNNQKRGLSLLWKNSVDFQVKVRKMRLRFNEIRSNEILLFRIPAL